MHFVVNWNENGRTRQGELVNILRPEDHEVYVVEPFDAEGRVSIRRPREDLKLTPTRTLPNHDQPEML